MPSPATDRLQEVETIEELEGAPCYFPLANGRYEVKPGLMKLTTDFGNGRLDRHLFQIDTSFANYRQAKLLARAERLDKYYQTLDCSNQVSEAIVRLIVDRLTQEYPEYFDCQTSSTVTILHNHLTQETLYFDPDWQLQHVRTPNCLVSPPYASAFDALAAQIQEDFAVIRRSTDGTNWISAGHICYPSYWALEEKIGREFAVVHAPVAGMEKINQRSSAIVHTMITREPMVRFTWGLTTDTRLNHHPEPPSTISQDQWQGRQFDRQNPRLYLRIERQVIWGLPDQDAALFTIRTYFRDCTALKQDPSLRSNLISAIASMSPESLIYKGLVESKDSILSWLQDG